jgi:hypothetical protein
MNTCTTYVVNTLLYLNIFKRHDAKFGEALFEEKKVSQVLLRTTTSSSSSFFFKLQTSFGPWLKLIYRFKPVEN